MVFKFEKRKEETRNFTRHLLLDVNLPVAARIGEGSNQELV